MSSGRLRDMKLSIASLGAEPGARFIEQHLIRVAEASFDAGMRLPGGRVNVDRMLGLGDGR